VFGTRCELKNLNSFKNIKLAIDAEIARHVELIESGGKVEQETRLYDVQRNETRSMRSKEDAQDYRYFPEPDLPPLVIEPAFIERVRGTLPELPAAKRRRYVEVFKLPEYDAGVLTADRAFSELYERCVEAAGDAKKVSNWFMTDLSKLLNESGTTAAQVRFSPAQFGALLGAVEKGTISLSAAKQVFEAMFATGADPLKVIEEKGLAQVSDTGALEKVVDEVLAANAKNVESYRAGKTSLMPFFMGQVMKATKGKANPKLVSELLEAKLKGQV
jgi:aspartyl-tRNA(Asn)/glutamyl-tRNA(Gln) amidotransferase subunit B